MRRIVLPIAVWMACASCTTTETVLVANPPDTASPAVQDTSPPPDAGAPVETYSVACPSDLAPFAESEPNDHWKSSNDLGPIATPGFCVQGRVLCGNDGKDGYGNPGDHVRFQVSEAATATFSLSWDANADFDLLASDDFDGGKLIVTFKSGKGESEGGSATLQPGTPYYVSINCWEGTPGDFALAVRW